MIEEFHRILRTPKRTPTETLEKTQDLILCTMQQNFSTSLDIQRLQKIFEQVLGQKAFPNIGQTQITLQQQIQLNYRLVEHFIELTKINFVSADVYQALQDQTQRAEATIRSHIKIEQELKMYLEYLESKINKMQRQIASPIGFPEHLRRQLQIVQSRESHLQKQKVALVKKNEKLQNQLQALRKQIQLNRSPNISLRQSFVQTSKQYRKIPQRQQAPMSTGYKEYKTPRQGMKMLEDIDIQNSGYGSKDANGKSMIKMNGNSNGIRVRINPEDRSSDVDKDDAINRVQFGDFHYSA